MPQLYDLQGNPMTWAELKERAARYWTLYDAEGNPREYHPVRTGPCLLRWHAGCPGVLRAPGGHKVIGNCGCWCHSERA